MYRALSDQHMTQRDSKWLFNAASIIPVLYQETGNQVK